MVDNASILRKSTGFKQSESDQSQMFKGDIQPFQSEAVADPVFRGECNEKARSESVIIF